MAERNRLKQTWADGGTVFGAWCGLDNSFAAEALAMAGFDYVCVDAQHGLVGYEATARMIQAIGATTATPLVRVPANDESWICKALDVGAEGVIVPMVSTRAEAERAVSACRYAPQGIRSFGVMRARMTLGLNPAEVNEQVVCLVMIETREGVQNAEEICAVPGLDGVYIGPADLALSLGVAAWRSDEHAQAIERVRQCCEANGIIPAIHAGSGERGRSLTASGFRMATVASDISALVSAGRRELRTARDEGPPQASR